jgi:hypothetical protein
MPKVTNAFTTYMAKGNREDLANAIFNIDPVDTIFISLSDTRDISNVMFDWQTEKLPAVNGSNAQVEGFTAVRGPATPTVRVGNVAQLSERDATVSGTQQEADAAGKGEGEMAHQMALAGKALKRDMETILLSANPYNAGADDTTPRTTRGLEHWITTNAFYGATGANPVSATAVVTDGTPRAFTEALLGDTIQAAYDKGAEPDHLLMGSYIKRVFSTFEGRQQSRVTVGPDTIVAAADFYVSDFGELKAYPSRYMRPRTLIGWDPEYSKIAYYRKMVRKDLGIIGDADTKLLISEYGLQCSNEAAHFKIADLITSGPITLMAQGNNPARVIGGVTGVAATGDSIAYNADGTPKAYPPAADSPLGPDGRLRIATPQGDVTNFDGTTTGTVLSKEGDVVASPGAYTPVPYAGLNPAEPPPPVEPPTEPTRAKNGSTSASTKPAGGGKPAGGSTSSSAY